MRGWLVTCGLVVMAGAAALAQEPAPGTAAADSVAAVDSVAVDSVATQTPPPGDAAAAAAAAVAADEGQTAPDGADDADDADDESHGFIHDVKNAPEVGTKANVTRVNYFARFNNSFKLDDGGSISDNVSYSYDSYRRQDRTVENRAANVNYVSGEGQDVYDLLPVLLRVETSVNWSEDVTVNSGGRRNERRDETRRAGISASRSRLQTGPLVQNLTAGWYYNESQGVNLGEVSDRSNAETTGAIRTGIPLSDGLKLATRLYGTRRTGDNALSGIDSPTETTGDTIGVGGYFASDILKGKVVFTQADFDRSYLDYRRDANGLIDTTNIPEGTSKIVEELEEKDAWEITWDSDLTLGRFDVSAKMSHKYDKQQYNQSLVGIEERVDDRIDLKLAFPVGRDSLVFTYKYQWTWDDQQFLNATASRGRQYKKSRDFKVGWTRNLFADTDLKGEYRVELSQDIAENEFNENDRDRLTEQAQIKLESRFSPRFSADLSGEYLKREDIAIRKTLSANNNVKRTYEVAPQYRWTVSDRVKLQQTFRMYIQYQDYVFDALENVRKEDTFNKRGNLSSRVTYNPNDRLEIIVKHDFNKKYNGTRASTDLAGRDTYRRDSNQTIGRIEFSLAWELNEWFEVQTASFRTEDETKRFRGEETSVDTNYSGELWVGAVIDRSWGPTDNPLQAKARIKRFLAYGPNVTDTSDDYWEADVLMKWSF